MKHFYLSFILLGWSTLAAAEIYQWTDSDGKIHYGDGATRQPGQKVEKLEITTDAVKLDPEAERTRQQLRLLNKMSGEQRETEAQRAAQSQQQHQQLQQRCQELQDKIRNDQQTAVFYYRDEAGNRVLWTDAQRVAYRERLQATNQQYCGADQ